MADIVIPMGSHVVYQNTDSDFIVQLKSGSLTVNSGDVPSTSGYVVKNLEMFKLYKGNVYYFYNPNSYSVATVAILCNQ